MDPTIPEKSQQRRPASIFLSYARVDRSKAARLARALEGAGHTVWWDARMEGGAAFARKIEEQLHQADAVVVVWSEASAKSDWVADEAADGRDAGKLVPVTIDGTLPPIGFRQYHAVDLSGWSGSPRAPEFDALLAGIAATVGRSHPVRPAAVASRRVSRRTIFAAGGAGLAAACAGIVLVLRPWASGAGRNSVAVLPFRNLSGDPAQAYFSDGLAEEVRSALSLNPALRVAAPTSSNLFRDAQDAKQVGKRLKVAFLLEGSVRRSGNIARIDALLVDTANGFTSWSQGFERHMEDIFAVQTEIAATAADALAVRVKQPQNLPGGTRNSAAYDSYLRGRALFNADAGEQSDRAALARFEQAIGLDPNYAAAQAARSRALAAIASQYATADLLKPLHEEAIVAARRAVQLAPDLAAAELSLGYAIFTGRLDFRQSRTPFERSAQLGAGDADILLLYALYAARAGRFAPAQESVQRAVDLDPLNPRAWRAVASVAYISKRYPDVFSAASKALSLNPKIANAHTMIGNALYVVGRLDEAKTAYEAEPNQSFRLAGLAIVKHKLGDRKGAQAALAQLIQVLGDSALYQQAQIHAQWGDVDAALKALDKARVVGDSGLLYLATDPMLAPVRTSADYASLVRAMGLG